jgi:hypothetical protein
MSLYETKNRSVTGPHRRATNLTRGVKDVFFEEVIIKHLLISEI